MQLSIEHKRLRVDLQGLERVFSLRGRVELALGDIGGVGVRAPHDLPKRYWLSLRVPGTFLPFIIKAGTYFIWREGKFRREFWYTTAAKHFLVVNMKSGRYERVVLGLDDAEEWARRIREAMAGE